MLKGKTAIVTGASKGIGYSIVELFAQNGADVWACARSESDEFEKDLRIFENKYGTSVKPLYFDVTDSEGVKAAVKKVGEISKTIDVLVNNAGVSVERFFNMTSIDMVTNTLNVNFVSQLAMSQIVSKYMMKSGKGSIVNIASVTGLDAVEGGIAYGSSKAAVIYATKTLALELAKYGIRVNAVSPGFIDTDMWKNRKPEIIDKIISETPLHRQGTPGEVAQVVLFLASEMSSFITGQNIVVDGGRRGGFLDMNFKLKIEDDGDNE